MLDTPTARVPKIQRLETSDLEWAADFLANVFLLGPPITKLFAPRHLPRQLRYFMRCNAALALNSGECFATDARDGVALWLRPGRTSMTLRDMWQAGMFRAPLEYGLLATLKVLGFAYHVDAMHKRCAPMPHYYLFLIGVDPQRQRQGVSTALVNDMLARIDAEGLPVFLETQSRGNVEIYEKLGFVVVEKRPFPGAATVYNWGMLRPPGAPRGGKASLSPG